MYNSLMIPDNNPWLNYFDRAAALESVFAHIAALPSSRNTTEQHTLRVYKSGLAYFINWIEDALPTPSAVQKYIAHLTLQKNLKSSTVGSKYLAPLRLYLKALAVQHIPSRLDGSPLNTEDRHFIVDAREQLRAAVDVPTPRDETTSNLPPLWQHGERLALRQINQLYQICDPNTIAGSRDLAILYVGFTSALRIAEIQRMTLSSIRRGKSSYEVHVRGKRSNIDPVPLDSTAYQLIMEYVAIYNADLETDDPRYIHRDTPLWQPLQHNDTPFPVGYQGIDPSRGMSSQSLRMMLKKRCQQVQEYDNTMPVIAPHDMRRSAAALGHEAGMDYPELQRLLRHRNMATTFGYIGKAPDLSKSIISQMPDINFVIPHRRVG